MNFGNFICNSLTSMYSILLPLFRKWLLQSIEPRLLVMLYYNRFLVMNLDLFYNLLASIKIWDYVNQIHNQIFRLLSAPNREHIISYLQRNINNLRFQISIVILLILILPQGPDLVSVSFPSPQCVSQAVLPVS